MIQEREFERLFKEEFKGLAKNLIWQNDLGEYEAFGKYRIVPLKPGYRVYCSATEIGVFNSTQTALSWCIADKNGSYNVAREMLEVDNKLQSLQQDIKVRAAVGDRSKNADLKETIERKLESKIIHKKQLENHLSKCVNWAKYIQQRGFENETARTGRNQPNKASR
jgi:hypothetical protein